MKIRNGFVSNSSSTSFTFLIKGDNIEDVFSMIKKYDQYFSLYGDWGLENEDEEWSCDAQEVIAAMRTAIGENKELALEDLLTLKKGIEENIEEYSKRAGEEGSNWIIKIVMDWANDLATIDNAIKKNFKNYMQIDFGDNHGDIDGGKIGNLMDYEGRSIYINKPDFIVYTEQNR